MQDDNIQKNPWRRKPWQAGLFSLLLPGLGQLYNGEPKKGALFFCLKLVIYQLSLLVMLHLTLTPVNIIIPTLIILFTYLYIIINAIRNAYRLGDGYQRKKYNKWYIYLAVYVIAGIVINLTVTHLNREMLMQAYKLPAGSMKETLQIGDHILVNKRLYRSTAPQRFDIIVFQYPWDDDRDFIKRVIALPGDQVEIRNDQVFVNGQSLEEPYLAAPARRRARPYHFGPLPVPKQGDVVEIRADRRLYINNQPVAMPAGDFRPNPFGPSLNGFQTFYRGLFPNPDATLERPVEPFQVAQDYYFTLGDNRHNSRDSRHWGFAPRSTIKGRAAIVYWSWNCHARSVSQHLRCIARLPKHVRWERLGKRLN